MADMHTVMTHLLATLLTAAVPGDPIPGWDLRLTNPSLTWGLYAIDRKGLKCRRHCRGGTLYVNKLSVPHFYHLDVLDRRGRVRCTIAGSEDRMGHITLEGCGQQMDGGRVEVE